MHHTVPQRHVGSKADIPVVDLSNLIRRAAISQIDDACTSHGFSQVLDHGLPVETMRATMAVAEDFFRLSPEEKAKLYPDHQAKKMPMRLSTFLRRLDFLDLDRPAADSKSGDACSSHAQLLNSLQRWRAEVCESGLSTEKKTKLYDLAKNLRLSTSFKVRKESQINLTGPLQIVKNEDLQEIRVLGAGASGTVYHGKWRGTDVAIKRFMTVIFSEPAQDFWREAEILSMLRHPNVVAFYGVVKDGPGGTLATLTEFMVNGSLRQVLKREGKFSDLRKRLLIAMDAAFGMEYLHSKNIVHFDLKCDNLLVNLGGHTRPICKVGDFGLSKIRSNTLVSGGVRGTLRWMAPELFHESKVSEKVDVFSFGIVMWELLTGEVPYANMDVGAIVDGIVNNTLRPTVPANCEPEWRRLMEQCWSPDPAQRPAFTEIAARLQSMAVAI